MLAGDALELLEVGHKSDADAVIVCATGDIDSLTVDRLIAVLTDALELAATHPARLLIVDLRSVNLFGSAALNAVLDCHEAGSAAGTSVCLLADQPQVLQPIEVTELDKIFDIRPSLAAALQSNDRQW